MPMLPMPLETQTRLRWISMTLRQPQVSCDVVVHYFQYSTKLIYIPHSADTKRGANNALSKGAH